MKSVRILIADDHSLVRRGLRSSIADRSDWEVCAEAESGTEAVEKARAFSPDIAILDYSMPELNGLEAARIIRREFPGTEVLMLTMHDTEAVVRAAVAAGVHGYILKSDAGRLLETAIDSLLAGKPFYSGRVSQLLLHHYDMPGQIPMRGGNTRLSPRERQVLQLIAEGKSTKDVANHLGITRKTAESHRTNVMRKLNLHCVTDVVHFAIRNKIVEA